MLCVYYFPTHSIEQIIIAMCAVITIAGIAEIVARKTVSIIAFCVYALLCFWFPLLLAGIPLLCYDLVFEKEWYVATFGFLPFVNNYTPDKVWLYLFSVIFICLILILKYVGGSYDKLSEEHHRQRDDLIESSIKLENRLTALADKSEYEIKLATLNERNRIAREIHDSVGHQLSSSLIQIGALLTITKDEAMRENLELLKETLTNGMNNIRSSVHNLRDDSIDLYSELYGLTSGFTFCKATLKYEAETNLTTTQKYAVIMVVKEALSNVMRHSNATEVSISFFEHPKLYQLIILDNGTTKSYKSDSGIGLENIEQRINALGGHLNIERENGFRIFISFPKGENVT